MLFNFNSLFKRSNHEMLQNAVRKNMLVSFSNSERKLHDAMFNKKSIMSVNMNEIPVKPVEPGQPENELTGIHISTNTIENKSYIRFDKTYFDSIEQFEIDEMIYQMFNQIEVGITAKYTIDVPQLDGSVKEVIVESAAGEYTAEEKKEKEDEAEEGEGSCDSEKEAEETTTKSESTQEMKEEKSTKMSEADKEANPKYATATAKWGKNSTGRAADIFNSGSSSDISSKHLKEIHEVEAILEHSIKGSDGGKSKDISPSKRLNMRAIITESSEREYITKRGVEGKDIKINVIVDRSGSMHGRPSTESNILIQALNNLAFKYPELDVEIMLSETSNYFNFALPVHGPDSKELWKFSSTGGAEGLARTFRANFNRMKRANVNLVYTDGDICDEAIDKDYMKSQEIELVGMYVNKDFSEEEVMGYYEKNAKYFTHTIIRDNMKSLVNELANRILMSKDSH